MNNNRIIITHFRVWLFMFRLNKHQVLFSFEDVSLSVSLQDDLSVPLMEENLDGSSGALFPFFDPDTNMLYLAGKVTETVHSFIS